MAIYIQPLLLSAALIDEKNHSREWQSLALRDYDRLFVNATLVFPPD